VTYCQIFTAICKNIALRKLRRSQVEMLQGGNWQADPAYWASYQLTGVTR